MSAGRAFSKDVGNLPFLPTYAFALATRHFVSRHSMESWPAHEGNLGFGRIGPFPVSGTLDPGAPVPSRLTLRFG
jgi:hypothetical protein